MRAEIEVREVQNTRKTGFFSKETYTMYNVYPNITFTNEEKAALSKSGLWNRVCYEFTRNLSPAQLEMMDGEDTTLRISIQQIAQPDFHLGFSDPVEANECAQEIERDVLPLIKHNITAVPSGKRVVDL